MFTALVFTFNQYLGFLAFLIIALMGFWLLLFLTAFIPYWIGGAIKERMQLKRAEQKELEE
ncbi:MAG TPA: hypothetical protein VK050_02110 [Flavobacteriaceae bacterium]|nr:hypothetical protein [Flavobacteriaceae bacterium]